MNVDFPGIALQRSEDALILRSERPLHTLSSAVIGGGFAQVQTMLSRYVSKYYNNDDPVTDLMAFAAEQGVTGDFIGLLTAVPMRKARHITLTDGALCVSIQMIQAQTIAIPDHFIEHVREVTRICRQRPTVADDGIELFRGSGIEHCLII